MYMGQGVLFSLLCPNTLGNTTLVYALKNLLGEIYPIYSYMSLGFIGDTGLVNTCGAGAQLECYIHIHGHIYLNY